MTIKVGINGFGRIGRMVLRAAVKDFPDIEVVGVNDLLEPGYLAYMLHYDSVHGRFKGTIAIDGSTLLVNDRKILVTAEKDPGKIQWKEVGVELVVESTGFLTKETAGKHTWRREESHHVGAGQGRDLTFVFGVNDKTYARRQSCPTHPAPRTASPPLRRS